MKRESFYNSDILVGKRMGEAITQSDYTVVEVADGLHIGASDLRKCILGQNPIHAKILHKVAMMTDKPLRWFFVDETTYMTGLQNAPTGRQAHKLSA